jgi:hypothetical protein
MSKRRLIITLLLVLVTVAAVAGDVPDTLEEIEIWWKAGKTLPLETARQYPFDELKIKDDTGINVLIDMAHKCDFFTLWTLGGHLHKRGLRTVGSHATLDTLLKPGSPCRVRIPVAPKVHPFGWWAAPEFNVVLTQAGRGDPGYIPEERQALKKFVRQGGGLVVSGAWVKNAESAKTWTLNRMLDEYGASVTEQRQSYDGKKWPGLKVDDKWEVVIKGDKGGCIYARRRFGKGRIVLFASSAMYRFDKKNAEDLKSKCDFLADAIKWAAEGKPAVGREARLPWPMWGGGGIYQESQKRLDGIVCYYSKNQIPELIKTVDKDFPAITADIFAWVPSARPKEPMYLILCSGGGGGWAVNAYLPKEASTISTSPGGIRSIFAHEQAHTMAGPCEAADHPFGGNRGEEHAGWFQGKVNAKYNGDTGPNRQCGSVFVKGYHPAKTAAEDVFKKSNLDKWRSGHDRMMIWYVWQKLDDRYGTTWYPRWRWVQGQRWKDQPERNLTWEESIEDMSIAVGEDLFEFFANTGKQLNRKRFATAVFMGREITLPVAPIAPTPPGDVCLDDIGDYTKPITIKKSD